MHIDGEIDSDSYHDKLKEYKKRQCSITNEMREHINGDKKCLITAKTVLDLAKLSKEILYEFQFKGKTATSKFRFFELEIGWKKAVGNTARTLFDPHCSVTSTSESPGDGFEPTTN